MAIIPTDQVDIRMIKELLALVSEPSEYLFAVDIGDEVHYKITLAQLAQLIKEIIMTDRIKSDKGIAIKAGEVTNIMFKDDEGNNSPFESDKINLFINAFADGGYRVELQPVFVNADQFQILVDQDLTLDYTAVYVPNAVTL